MEVRKITVIDTRRNSVNEIETNATTVAELKRDLHSAGISTEGMTIQEGLTKTEFINDNAILPTNVPYKGGITNKLVIRLTNTNKKIESGITRKELYELIKAKDLAEAIKDAFGINYTRVSNDDLAEFLGENNGIQECPIKEALEVLVRCLYDNDCICCDEMDEVMNILNKGKNGSSSYSAKELNEMFEDM